MSDQPAQRRIRAQNSASDAHVMGFVLDAPIQPGRTARFDGADDGAPLSRAMFGIEGVQHIEASGATIWVRKAETADWSTLKPAIAAAIRQVLEETDTPLGAHDVDADTALLQAVEALLDRQVNPSVAAHGGHIGAERVAGGVVFLRMSGGCQGCAASAATLREGVERMLRAALPEIREIVDVTDHAEGSNPFYTRDGGPSAVFNRPVPPQVISWQGDEIRVDPDYLAPRLGISTDALSKGLQSGEVVATTEIGTGAKAGTSQIILRSATRAWAAEVFTDGTAREIPPPRVGGAAPRLKSNLATQVRAHLDVMPGEKPHITYGALARALGYWAPGSVGRITRALETTMQEDAAANRPFIAARAVGRGPAALPGRGFFDLARALGRGPDPGESDQAFHARELARVGVTEKSSITT
ncbi:DUF6522 family protein [Oceaniglobus ichthyenteri]|uniref:NifU family protein n=1 Tax=Oceaniglobus ichthyenteri TaxID=2136177 RepID=UPI000D3940CB|nr:DUF6522 family protein [Oceaniglobus ichthyenteri]